MSAAGYRHQHGVILLVAMVTALALAFAGMSLVRAVSTGVVIGGNLNARQHAMLAASAALEHDVTALFESAAIDTSSDDPAHNYFASRRAGEDPRGVPGILQTLADYPATWTPIDAGGGYFARHVIERLCVVPGVASPANCTLTPPSVEAASGARPPGEPQRKPHYRITIRVDGPGAAAAFVQSVVSDRRPNPRLSWRALDE
jgi:Tfp pilus assembly protein PilX